MAMTNKSKVKRVGILALLIFVFYRLRNGNVVVEPNTTDTTGRSANLTGANYASQSTQISTTVSPVPVFLEAPNIAYSHARFRISNSGQFNVLLKKNGTILKSDTVTGPMSSVWLSDVIQNYGSVYELVINGVVSTITAPNEVQTQADWTDVNQDDNA